MHGVDGVLFAWVGPANDTAGLSLNSIDGVESAQLAPETPFRPDAYRPALADSVVAGAVRLWFLTHPRAGWEASNFPGLTTAPCLPSKSAIREILRRVATTAGGQPYHGPVPLNAGRLRVAPDGGISITQPGDQHLIQVGERTLGRSLTLPGFTGPLLAGQDVFVYTETPPAETDTTSLATSRTQPFKAPRTTAGGLDVLLFIQKPGLQEPPDPANIEDVRRIAIALNRDPFLGQPVP